MSERERETERERERQADRQQKREQERERTCLPTVEQRTTDKKVSQ